MDNQNFWKAGTRIGVFFAILFAVCFAWFYVRGGGEEIKNLHDNLFALSFLGWTGMNALSFILGIVQTFVWGYIALALWNLSGMFFRK